MSRINVDFIAFTDPRFMRLATLMGYADHDHARSKVEYLWLECTNRGTNKLPQWVVESLMGEPAPNALIESELARWSGGRGDSKTRLMHICGAEERCLWKRAKDEQSSKGGKARAQSAQRTAGRFAPAPAGTTPPAKTSAPAPAPAPAQEERGESVSAVHKPAVEAFDQYYRRTHDGAKPTWDATRISQVKTLVGKHGVPEILRRLDVLERTPPQFPPAPWDLGTFVQHFDKCAAAPRPNGNRPAEQPRHLPWLKP